MKLSSVTRVACGVAVSLGALAALQVSAATSAGALSPRAASATYVARPTVAAREPGRAVSVRGEIRTAATQASRPASAATGTSLTPVQRYSMVRMRRPGTPTAPSGVVGRNSVPCEITCSEIRMSYFDGPVLSNAKVEGVFWGNGGNYTAGAGPGGEMPAFYNAIGHSDWWGGLSEYNTNEIVGGSGQYIGPVSSLGETTITPSAPDNGATITDAEMQTELASQITAGHLPYPALDGTGNVTTLYALYFPDNKTVCLVVGECDTNIFCAYHNSFSYNGMNVPYMVLPADTAGTPIANGCGLLPTLTNDYTSYVSHELVEAATDTGIGLDTAAGYAYPAAWGDNNNNVGEVMDACDTGEAASSAELPGTADYVQAIWSNQQGTCTFAKPYLNVTPTSATITAGQSQTYTAIALGPTNVSGSATFTISPPNHGGSCTGDVCTSTESGTYTVSASYAGAGSDPVTLIVEGALCQPGTYSPTGLTPCTSAPPGTYVAGTGATSPTSCAVGTYNALSGQTSCDTAPTGTYVATTGATEPTFCEAGTYNPNTGSTTASACLLAPPGSYVPGPGAADPTFCPAGTFSPSAGATGCFLASPGDYVASIGSSSETPCAPGSFSAASGAVTCTLADPGSFVANPGSSGETQCAAGSFSATSGAVTCTLADPGSFVAGPGATGETSCAAGSFSAAAGATTCTLAPAGSYVAGTGATAATKCAAGSFSAGAGATTCTLAPAGSYVAGTGATAATKCAAGSFSAASGAISCTLAPPGTYVAGTGATGATQCALGTYNPASGATSCLEAPLNTYVATVGATAATACPSHTFTLQQGSTSKAACLYVAITTTTLHGGTLYSKSKVRYSATLKAKGGTHPYTWSLVHGSKLPPGLTLDATTGVISGKATKVGTYTFTVKVLDKRTASQGQHGAEATLSITIMK